MLNPISIWYLRKQRAFFAILLLVCLLLIVLISNGVALVVFTKPVQAARTTPPPPIIVTHSVIGARIPVGQSGSTTASCLPHESLLGGGYNASAFETVSIIENYPSSKNSWTVTANNLGSPSFVVLTTFVYCLKAYPAQTPTIVHVTGSAGTATAVCSSGSVLTNGGFRGNAVTKSAPAAQSWQVIGNGVVQSYAVCARHHFSAEPAVSATFMTHIAFGPSDGAAPQCAAGQSATGGGYSLVSGPFLFLPVDESAQSAPDRWATFVFDNGSASEIVTAWTVCVVVM